MNTDSNTTLENQWIKYWTDIFASNPGAAENIEATICPPEPAPDEKVAADDPGFVASCRADVVSMSNGPVDWVDQLLTRSPKWGLIWRADFLNPRSGNKIFPSRVACWKRDDGGLGMTISGMQYGKLKLNR